MEIIADYIGLRGKFFHSHALPESGLHAAAARKKRAMTAFSPRSRACRIANRKSGEERSRRLPRA
jgi:hypothetical protein